MIFLPISIILLGGMFGAFLYFKNKSAEAEREYFNAVLTIKFLVYEITVYVHTGVMSLKNIKDEILDIILSVYKLLKDDLDKSNITLKEVFETVNNHKIDFIDVEIIPAYGYLKGVFGLYRVTLKLIRIATLTPKDITNQTEEYRIKRMKNILKHELSHAILYLLYKDVNKHHDVMKEKGFNC